MGKSPDGSSRVVRSTPVSLRLATSASSESVIGTGVLNVRKERVAEREVHDRSVSRVSSLPGHEAGTFFGTAEFDEFLEFSLSVIWTDTERV